MKVWVNFQQRDRNLSNFLKVLVAKTIIYLLVRLSHLSMVAIYRKQRDIQSSVTRSFFDMGPTLYVVLCISEMGLSNLYVNL